MKIPTYKQWTAIIDTLLAFLGVLFSTVPLGTQFDQFIHPTELLSKQLNERFGSFSFSAEVATVIRTV